MGKREHNRFRYGKELLFFILLAASVASWGFFVLPGKPDALAQAETGTWSTSVRSFYALVAHHLRQELAERSATDGVDSLAIMPVAGSAMDHHEFATPSQADVLHYFQRARLKTADGTPIRVRAARNVETETEVGLQLSIDEFVSNTTDNRQQFTALLSAFIVESDLDLTPFLVNRHIAGTNSTLPWFVRVRTSLLARVALTVLSLVLMTVGLLLAFVYYRLVAGTFVGPPWLAVPINELRAATGLISCSLVFLTGLILFLLLWQLVPDTGTALEAQRTHTDVIVAADESVIPQTADSSYLAEASAEIAAACAGMMLDVSEQTKAEISAEEPFWTWFRFGLPATLQTQATELRISRGATWRIFSVAADRWFQLPEFTSSQWLPANQEVRKQLILDTVKLAGEEVAFRSFSLPIPWDEQQLPQLDAGTLLQLQAGPEAQSSEQSRLTRVLVGSFQWSERAGYDACFRAALEKPPAERVYAVLLPDLPQSASRNWQSLEGKLAIAGRLADRVVTLYPVPNELNATDALELPADLAQASLQPDMVLPVYHKGGEPLARMANAGRPRDLQRGRDRLARDPYIQKSSGETVGKDFANWVLAGDTFSMPVSIFSIPRSPFVWLVIGLGSIFLVAGIRCEENAQGLQSWGPPVLLLFSGLILPAILGSWIHSRSDSLRYVIFGYADLAYWGACFLWLCVGVVPFFLGRARVGLRRGWSMACIVTFALAWVVVLPVLPAVHRQWFCQASLAGVVVLATGTWLLTLVVRPPAIARVTYPGRTRPSRRRLGARGCLNLTCLLFLVIAAAYIWLWGWENQDIPAVCLFGLFLIMVSAGWKRGLYWWRIEPAAFYDRIVWLHPINRLALALVLTFAGAAALFCSFPTEAGDHWINGYVSYCLSFCIVPLLICSLIVIAVDLLHKEIA